MRKLGELIGASLGQIVKGSLIGVGLLASVAYAQVFIGSSGLFGNEAVLVQQTGPGGPGIYTTTGHLMNGTNYAYFSTFPASFTIGTVAGGVNTAGVVNGGVIAINAANTAQTFTLPPNPVVDGTVVRICNVTAAAWATNAVTVVANSNQTLIGSGTLTTQAAGTCSAFMWSAPNSDWFVLNF